MMMPDLSVGDFLYQSDQELFLVVVDTEGDSYTFAVHGWREIDKERIDEYVADSRSKVHHQSDVERLVGERGDDEAQEKFDKLKQLFAVYEDANIPDDGPHSDFAFEEK